MSKSLLQMSKYEKIIYELNNMGGDSMESKTIHKLFEEHAHKMPDSIAKVQEGVGLTYKEINDRANQLAHYLESQYAITNNDRIALCLDDTKYILIAILATLKAGGAYVSIDPDYSANTVSYIIKDSKSKVLLTKEKYAARLRSIIASENLDLNLEIINNPHTEEIINKCTTDDETINDADSIACVAYTNTATDQPKPVIIKHKVISDRLNWMNEAEVNHLQILERVIHSPKIH